MTRASESVFSLLRVLLLLTATAAVAVGCVEIFRGEGKAAFAAALVGSAAYGVSWWLWRGRVKVAWIAFALLAAGLATDGRWVFAGVAVAALVAVVVVNVRATVRYLRGLGTLRRDRVGADAVMPGAEPALAELEAAGFRRVGGYSATIHGKLAIFTLLIGTHADRLAVVTDHIVQVVSRFGGRFFVSTNVGALPMPADVLRQQPAYDTDVIAAHEAAIEVFARQGVRPDLFEADADVLEAMEQLEARAARFLSETPLRNVFRYLARRGTDLRAIGDDVHSRRRIEAWMRSQPSG